MSMSDVAEAALLDLYFLNTNAANIGDATGLRSSTAAGSFYLALHTADPGEAGTQVTSEIAYTSYARVAVARSGAGWTRSVSTISNAALVQFPQCTGGSGTATHFSIGTASSGAGSIVLSGALSASLAISNGIQPQFAIGALTATAD
jgi:hypothetical protein